MLRAHEAVVLSRQGRTDEAEKLCRAALKADAHDLDAHRLLSEILASSGRTKDAIDACRRLAQLDPRDAGNLRRLAQLLSDAGDPAAAIPVLERALELEPGNPRALNNLGFSLTAVGRADDAVPVLQQALSVQPVYPIALNNLGLALSRLGRIAEAIEQYERALALNEKFPEALVNLATALGAAGRPAEALQCHERADRLRAASPGVLAAQGKLYLAAARPADALAAFDRALQLQPALAHAHAGRGAALAALGRLLEAVDAYAQAAKLDPHNAAVFLDAGHLMLRLGRAGNAHASFCAALELAPNLIPAEEGRVMSLLALNRHEEAVPALAALQARAPVVDYLAGHRLHAQLHCCDWSDYEPARRMLADAVRRGARVDPPLSFIVHNDSPADQLSCARIYAADKCSTVSAALHPTSSRRAGRLRIAYLSTDFRDHPVGQLIAGVLEKHDHAQYEIFALAAGPDDQSDLRRRIKSGVEHFIDVGTLDDAALAARMASLEIDVAVDLGGHTAGGRTRALAFRPAPLQVSFLGFPGTLGADYIDYIVADRHVIPEAERGHYAEQIIYLPDSYLPNDAFVPSAGYEGFPGAAAPSRDAAGLPERGFIYCCFNAFFKFSPTLFDAWMRILGAVPESLLWLRGGAPAARRNLDAEALRRGIDPQRLVFAPRVATLADHHARLALADLFLDTSPYNAHTTASDALRTGVPVITLPGRSFASRVATSLLETIGLAELSAQSVGDYERLAVELARAPPLLQGIKARLRCAAANSPLFDPARFTAHLEEAYGQIWARHTRGERPQTVMVPAMPSAPRPGGRR